jgi:hypothetical protein
MKQNINPADFLSLSTAEAIALGRKHLKLDSIVSAIDAAHSSQRRLDAGETAQLARSLLFVKAQSIDVSYPNLRARELLPVDGSVPPGAESYSVLEWDYVGEAKHITNYADDLPRVDAFVKETIRKVYGFGDSYAWSVQDLRRVALGLGELDTKRQQAAREVFERKVESLASVGDAVMGLEGILKAANVPVVALANAGTWATKATANPDHIIADVNKLINSIPVATNGVESADTVVMDIGNLALISTTARSTTTDTTILQFLRANHPGVNFSAWFPCGLANATNNGPRMVAYRKSAMTAELVIPLEFTEHPPQERNLAFVVNCEARCGGVAVHRPKGIAYMDGI